MKPACVQKHLKHDILHSMRYKLGDNKGSAFNKGTLYGMYLENVDNWERIHKKEAKRIKVDSLRRTMDFWDWIEARGEPGQRYYVRVDEPPKTEFSDFYELVLRTYRSCWKRLL